MEQHSIQVEDVFWPRTPAHVCLPSGKQQVDKQTTDYDRVGVASTPTYKYVYMLMRTSTISLYHMTWGNPLQDGGNVISN